MSGKIKNTVNEEMKAWQQDFYQGIFNPVASNIKQACKDICSTEKLSAEDRLSIYRGSILGGMTSALMGIYPVCEKLVGEAFFTQMVAGFLRENPSNSPDMGHYGDQLGEYLARFVSSNAQAQELVYLPDTARLEWLWHKAFNALSEDDLVMNKKTNMHSLAQLADVAIEDQGRIQFFAEPSLAVMQADFPVHKIWQMNQQDEQEGGGDQQMVDLTEGAVNLMIRRKSDFSMAIDVISDDEYIFFNAICNGAYFAEIATLEFVAAMADILAASMQSGLLIGFDLHKEGESN